MGTKWESWDERMTDAKSMSSQISGFIVGRRKVKSEDYNTFSLVIVVQSSRLEWARAPHGKRLIMSVDNLNALMYAIFEPRS
jgi:hypothetical protein